MAGTPKDPMARPRIGRPAVGRDAPLERDEILTTALGIVKDEGLDTLSMRRLASDLGVTPMAVYHHVPDKPALIAALVDRVWNELLTPLPRPDEDLVEFVVSVCVRTRDLWLKYPDLAPFAVAVAESDDDLMRTTAFFTYVSESIGFPDVPLAYSAIQNVMMGSVVIAASRRSSSAYFGRDPKKMLARARRQLTKAKASENHRGVIEARFDDGDDLHYEATLRAVIAGLLAGGRDT